jgi:hypothetical protein
LPVLQADPDPGQPLFHAIEAVEGGRHEPTHRRRRITVGTDEVTHVDEDAEVGVVHRRGQLLDPEAVLAEL